MSLKQLAQSDAEPVAWRLVPIKPTKEMLDAADHAPDDDDWQAAMAKAYKAMLAVAPAQSDAEPVAWRWRLKGDPDWSLWGYSEPWPDDVEAQPLYTTPPRPDASAGLLVSNSSSEKNVEWRSTPAMRMRIRELARPDSDDYDRAVIAVLDDFENMLGKPL